MIIVTVRGGRRWARRSRRRSSSAAFLVACLAAVAGFSQALAKLSLDALIQRDVPEVVRTSAFARSETLLQMAWVVGGAIGIALPLNGALGMSVAAAIVAAGWLTTVTRPARRGPARRPRQAPRGVTPHGADARHAVPRVRDRRSAR